jgi:glycosyltransferase involved in cell wall biosynthesis
VSPSGRARHLLTVLHAAERSGPPIFALRWLRWLRSERPDWRLTTVFLADGDFTGPFAALGDVIVRPPPPGGRGFVAARAAEQAFRLRLRRLGPIHLAHVHCAGSMRVLPALPTSPVLCHVHELSVGLDYHLTPAARRHLPHASRYVTVSDAVRSEFVRRVPVDPALVERQWGFFDPGELAGAADTGHSELIGGRFVVVGSGVRHWRKGPELFVRSAVLARRYHPGVPWRFIWIGGDDEGALERLSAEAGVADLVTLIPHVAHPLQLIGAADVFLSTAREDAFPLVCVEAAALGRPIVTFDNGGAAELVRAAGGGRVVPFPDVTRLVSELHDLVIDEAGRRREGEAAAAFAAAELTLGVAGPRLLRSVERTMTR